MDLKATELLHIYSEELGIYIKEHLLTKLNDFNLQKKYAEDFDYADGEEGTNGIVYYYHEDKLVVIKTIYGGDDEDWEFTELGKEKFQQLLVSYLELLVPIKPIVILDCWEESGLGSSPSITVHTFLATVDKERFIQNWNDNHKNSDKGGKNEYFAHRFSYWLEIHE
jgi:hypothetical protein